VEAFDSRAPVPISEDLLREACAHAAKHGNPLLRRLEGTVASDNDPVITAVQYSGDAYRFGAEGKGISEIGSAIPRADHLALLREQLADNEAPESLVQALGEERVDALLRSAEGESGAGDAELDVATYSLGFGGPPPGQVAALAEWMAEWIDVSDEIDGDRILLHLRGRDPGYQALLAVLEHYGVPYIGGEIVWNDPDSGARVGRINSYDSMGDIDVTWFAEGHVAISCLQWMADLAGIPLRVEMIREE
jgi:hypothetical protein